MFLADKQLRELISSGEFCLQVNTGLCAAGEKTETTATASLYVDRCTSYFSIAVTKHLEQDN